MYWRIGWLYALFILSLSAAVEDVPDCEDDGDQGEYASDYGTCDGYAGE